MTKTEQIRNAMYDAMRAKDPERKAALSMLLSALKAKEVDKREPLTGEEEDAIIQKESKQMKESMETAPPDRTDLVEQCRYRLTVFSEFAPQQMDAVQIQAMIQGVLKELEITNPTIKDKGAIMKYLMPLVKGKADGALVNRLVGELFES